MPLVTPRRVGWLFAILLVANGVYRSSSILEWSPDGVATFWVLVLTALAALWYGWLTYLLLRKDHTPVVIVSYDAGATTFRNFGRGAALNITLLDSNGRIVVRSRDLGPNEAHSVKSVIRWTLERGRHLFYQDAYGRWHATKCLGQGVADSRSIPVSNAFIGRVYNPPPEARRAAMVRDVFEHWVQLNRSWDPRNWVRRGEYSIRKWRAERRIVRAIRAGVIENRLAEAFTPAEVSGAIDLEQVVAERFLENHVPGNADSEREFFVKDGERFRLAK